jgi:hypothetical protein
MGLTIVGLASDCAASPSAQIAIAIAVARMRM